MTRALLIDLQDLLAKQGENLVDEIRDASPEASGDLKRSVQSDVTLQGAVVSLTIKAAPYFRYVEGGRGKNKRFPPVAAIQRWCDLKGIDRKAAFPIARAIAERGIAPKHVLKGVMARRQMGIEQVVKKAFGQAVKIEATNLIKEVFGNKAA